MSLKGNEYQRDVHSNKKHISTPLDYENSDAGAEKFASKGLYSEHEISKNELSVQSLRTSSSI
jgi:hypothetical protein